MQACLNLVVKSGRQTVDEGTLTDPGCRMFGFDIAGSGMLDGFPLLAEGAETGVGEQIFAGKLVGEIARQLALA